MIEVIEKMRPHREPAIANELLQILAERSCLPRRREPAAPSKKKDRQSKKLTGERMKSSIYRSLASSLI